MGLAVLVVTAGYVFACFVIVSVTVFLVSKLRPNTTLYIILSVMFVLAWPVWVPLGTWSVFKFNCTFGEPGGFALTSYKIDTLAIDRNRSSYKYQPLSWGDKSETISVCREQCSAHLNALFREHAPWSSVLDARIKIEERWAADSTNSRSVKLMHGRFWLDSVESSMCISPLRVRRGEVSDKQCIAGEQIDKHSATHIAIMGKRIPKGFISDISRVEQYEHQLWSKEGIVARYRWYEWNLLPTLIFHSECPNEMETHRRDGHVWQTKAFKDKLFWDFIVASQYKALDDKR